MWEGSVILYYAIKCGRKYVKGIEPNEKYTKTSTAPTMGTRYAHSDFVTVLSNEIVYLERLTAINYLRTLMEEFRWGDKEPKKNRIDPKGVILCFFVMGKMGCVTKKVAPKTMIYVNIIREMEEKR